MSANNRLVSRRQMLSTAAAGVGVVVSPGELTSVVAQVMEGRRLPIPAFGDLPRGGPDAAAFEAVYPSFSALIARCWRHNQYDRPDFREIIEELR